MWTIIKFKKDSVALLKDLENKIGSDFIITDQRPDPKI